MDTKTCAVCHRENGSHFTYCSYCGALLPVVDKITQPSQNSSVFIEDQNLDGISPFEYRKYIGNNADSIIDAFVDLESEKRKNYFCPSIFFLGFFFGFYGLSAWFLNRKMKKIGFILLGLGILFTFINAFLNAELYRAVFLGHFNYTNVVSLFYRVLNSIDISKYVSAFFTFFYGFFGLYYYKQKASFDILRIKESESSISLPVELRIKFAGGTKLALGLLPFFLAVVLNILAIALIVI